jgi:hypothetical protein
MSGMPRAVNAVIKLYDRGWSIEKIQDTMEHRWHRAKSARAAQRLAMMYEATYII